MLIADWSDPLVKGENVTLNVQLAPASTLLPQLLVSLNSSQAPELMTMPAMLSEALPVFERVTVCGLLVEP
jgi:hypothetical protein